MKYSILTIALIITTMAVAQEDYRTKARQYEERKAADKVNTERLNTTYTNNLPNEKTSTYSNTGSDAQVKANAEAWWNKLKADLDAVRAVPLPGTTGGGFTDEQRYEFEVTGTKRRIEQTYVTSLLNHYHENLNGYLEKIKALVIACKDTDCHKGSIGITTDTFVIDPSYENGMLNGISVFNVLGDPTIKNINLTFKNNVLLGAGTIFYYDGSFENITYKNNILTGEAALIFKGKNEALFFNRNQGKINGLLSHSHTDDTRCSFLYRDDAMFTMLNSNHYDFTYPSERMYTGNFYLYIKEETMTKLFDDDGEGGFYSGEYKGDSDTPHGFGTHAWVSGNSYTGDIVNNVITGNGTFYYSDGGIYTGAVKKSQRQGKGTMRYSDGATYTGMQKDGYRHGEGILTRSDGYVIKGKFKDGYSADGAKFYNKENVEISLDEYNATEPE